ncbi:PH domain-containing protein [Streptomyces sp. DH24]|uniref:PH domain-containing protein n=1 Tax=Streptomyces sp. DH24 TaxID=3040123 RepID=UPI002441842A|nr:PH domain-containing protein [Streptomyces sp. DH24]MDG9716280.1 PH domain-containing protein [Streptomyces sp. DH24]
MTTPEPSEPQPSEASEPAPQDRVHRSSAAIVGGVLLLAIAGWLGIDAMIYGEGRTPWLALATLLLVVPLVVAFTLRPAVQVNDDRLRVRNPFRVVVLPWGQVGSLRSGYSNEVVDRTGAKYQLWAIPVSLRARKRAARREMRAAAEAARGAGASQAPVRAETDRIMDELRERQEARAEAPSAQGEVTVRWAYEVLAPAVAGGVLLAVLVGLG